MLNYKEFKKEMKRRGHNVYKNGNYITVIPDNNYYGYSQGFSNAYEIISGFSELLKFVSMDHFNSWIYLARFKII